MAMTIKALAMGSAGITPMPDRMMAFQLGAGPRSGTEGLPVVLASEALFGGVGIVELRDRDIKAFRLHEHDRWRTIYWGDEDDPPPSTEDQGALVIGSARLVTLLDSVAHERLTRGDFELWLDQHGDQDGKAEGYRLPGPPAGPETYRLPGGGGGSDDGGAMDKPDRQIRNFDHDSRLLGGAAPAGTEDAGANE